MADASAERKASTLLLSLIASKALVPGSFSEKKSEVADEEQRTQTMMYAARMRYLDDKDQMTPDPLFMTRKQAQKVAQRHDTSATVSLRKLDVGPQGGRKSHATSAAATAGLTAAAWKKANNMNNRASVDERHQVWEAKFQAGCRFWQNVETAECRTSPPPNAQHIGGFPLEGLDDDDDENPPFPDSFAFLESGK
ncbi:hypothetical protein Gpo141_00005763 [Globisporangium polare]